MDTIYALATAPGKAGLAVVRISGPEARLAAEVLVGPLPEQGRTLRVVRDPAGNVIDQALILSFARGHSFTGETVVELHLHGSRAVVAAVFGQLGRNASLRQAEAGEFTRRAFENGNLDLTQVEGLSDLIDAETEGQRRQAQRILSGALAEKAGLWRRSVIRAVALIEATIDFVDEDVPVDVWPEVKQLVSETAAGLRAEMAGVRVAERIREGFEIAIVGAPNVGKSTLLNYLAGREAAITSEVAGTTRDVIEVRLDLDGLAVTLLDTAGLRDSVDSIEQIGISRAIERANAADLCIHLVLPGEAPLLPLRDGDMIIGAKADMSDGVAFGVSGKTGLGVDRLIAAISAVLNERAAGVGLAVRERHRVGMMIAAEHLAAVLIQSEASAATELVAEDLWAAIRALDSLVGRIDVEDILGEIFARFCIGK